LKAKKDDLTWTRTRDSHKHYFHSCAKQSRCDSFHHQVITPPLSKVGLYVTFCRKHGEKKLKEKNNQ
jgi:hypothetical protein